ncbi:heat stress transcription factor A-8 [Rhododendron vialii]|uniref:heat stress transcription factor A-8 n=1 Tax=Rhododendron vialii TaxID=182163 RepID=UPI00265E0F38|nr:heat stress transcription factor A-8 [Rhododendron vialii]XP_058184051.1 heat stress transcription factor A-8 [Rhododendron vialii]
MVKATENGALVAPFLLKCYEMVDDQSTDASISWSSTGDSFVILDVTGFETELLPKYFKHNNFSSFVRQLNIYGFRKIDTDHWEFSNDQFIKGQKHLLKNICRRKQPQVVVQRKSSRQKDKVVEAFEEDANSKLWEDVESLKTDKNALTQELVKLRQHQQTSQTNLVVLKEQLKGMEKNQQQLLSFIVMAMQSPGFLVQLLQPKENNWRMAETGKTVLKRVIDDMEPVPSDGMIVRYQPPMAQSPDPLSLPTLDSENLELGLSSDEVRDLLMNIDYTPGPMDEKLLSPESNWPMVIPELPDHIMDGESNWPMVIPELPDHIMDQMLLSSTLSENKEDGDCDTEELPNYGMEIESTSPGRQQLSGEFEHKAKTVEDPQNLKMDRAAFGNQLDENQDMEILTEMIGLLASECNLKHQSNF